MRIQPPHQQAKFLDKGPSHWLQKVNATHQTRQGPIAYASSVSGGGATATTAWYPQTMATPTVLPQSTILPSRIQSSSPYVDQSHIIQTHFRPVTTPPAYRPGFGAIDYIVAPSSARDTAVGMAPQQAGLRAPVPQLGRQQRFPTSISSQQVLRQSHQDVGQWSVMHQPTQVSQHYQMMQQPFLAHQSSTRLPTQQSHVIQPLILQKQVMQNPQVIQKQHAVEHQQMMQQQSHCSINPAAETRNLPEIMHKKMFSGNMSYLQQASTIHHQNMAAPMIQHHISAQHHSQNAPKQHMITTSSSGLPIASQPPIYYNSVANYSSEIDAMNSQYKIADSGVSATNGSTYILPPATSKVGPQACAAQEPPSAASLESPLVQNYAPLAVGDRLPPAHIDLQGACVNLQEFFSDRTGIIFGLVGAFSPTDSESVVPSVLNCMESFERLVDFVGCLVVNDPFVVKAWARKLGVTDQFTFIADSDAKFTKVLGMAQHLPDEGLGVRCRRFAAVVGSHARVRWIGFEEEALAENVLRILPRHVRTPWKSFLVGIGYTKKGKQSEDEQAKEQVVNNIQNMRRLLFGQGFCSEGDWQLVLCDKMADVFAPTKDNILNGMKWLVEGAQAGDALCFYFGGKGKRFVTDNGVETVGLMPSDHETAGCIDEWTIYDVLAPVRIEKVQSRCQVVPECCRLTIILDIENEESVTCALPYIYQSEVTVVPSGYMEAQIVSGTSETWTREYGAESSLKGEILVITLTGSGEVEHGCLSSLLNSVCAAKTAAAVSAATALSGDATKSQDSETAAQSPQDSQVILSYADQMDRMQVHLVEMGIEVRFDSHHSSFSQQRTVQLASSRPLNLVEEFSLADILP